MVLKIEFSKTPQGFRYLGEFEFNYSFSNKKVNQQSKNRNSSQIILIKKNFCLTYYLQFILRIFCVFIKLTIVKISIEAVLFHQLFVIALFNDIAISHNQN